MSLLQEWGGEGLKVPLPQHLGLRVFHGTLGPCRACVAPAVGSHSLPLALLAFLPCPLVKADGDDDNDDNDSKC